MQSQTRDTKQIHIQICQILYLFIFLLFIKLLKKLYFYIRVRHYLTCKNIYQVASSYDIYLKSLEKLWRLKTKKKKFSHEYSTNKKNSQIIVLKSKFNLGRAIGFETIYWRIWSLELGVDKERLKEESRGFSELRGQIKHAFTLKQRNTRCCRFN